MTQNSGKNHILKEAFMEGFRRSTRQYWAPFTALNAACIAHLEKRNPLKAYIQHVKDAWRW